MKNIKVICITDLFDDYCAPPFDKSKTYDVISIENGWYRIMTELDEDYLFPPHFFKIVN